jgi:hypothetical protein
MSELTDRVVFDPVAFETAVREKRFLVAVARWSSPCSTSRATTTSARIWSG